MVQVLQPKTTTKYMYFNVILLLLLQLYSVHAGKATNLYCIIAQVSSYCHCTVHTCDWWFEVITRPDNCNT